MANKKLVGYAQKTLAAAGSRRVSLKGSSKQWTVGTIIKLEANNGQRSTAFIVAPLGLFLFRTSAKRIAPEFILLDDVKNRVNLASKTVDGEKYRTISAISDLPFSALTIVLKTTVAKTVLTTDQSNIIRLWTTTSAPTWTWKKRVISVLQGARDAYYSSSQTQMSDEEYDYLEDALRKIAPNSQILKQVGSKVKAVGRKVELPYAIYSLDKVKAGTHGAKEWVKKLAPKSGTKIVVSGKYDGLSLMPVYENGKLKNVYTRGTATEGQDVTKLAGHISSIPKTVKWKKKLAVRGELIMPNSVFDKFYSKDKANPRNMVSGLVNSTKNIDGKALSRCQFIAHGLIDPVAEPIKVFPFLKAQGFKVAEHKVLAPEEISDSSLSATLKKLRSSQDFDTDGLVLTISHPKLKEIGDGNPTYSKAFKENQRPVQAEVSHVEWNASRYGVMKPRVVLKKPIKLTGVNVTYATGHNASYIKENGIGPGSVIEIVRSGDVIPYVVGVVKKVKPQLPNNPKDWKWNNTGVDIVLKAGVNAQSETKALGHFFTSIGVDGVAGGMIAKLYESGYTSVPQILELDTRQLMKIEGFQEKLAKRIHDNIKHALNPVELPLLCYASGVFGKSLGTTRFYQLWEEYGNDMCSWSGWKKKDIIEELAAIKGFGAVAANQFAERIAEFVRFYKGIKSFCTLASFKKAKVSSDRLAGENIVFTGVRLSKAEELIKSNGGSVGGSVNKHTTILVLKDVESGSSKANQARELGIKMMSVLQFEKWLKQKLESKS